ncbi:hypothetical protein GIV88_16785 [Pseudomonas syringae]|nr:hypothetical protein [Pseudomonas syringae]
MGSFFFYKEEDGIRVHVEGLVGWEMFKRDSYRRFWINSLDWLTRRT